MRASQTFLLIRPDPSFFLSSSSSSSSFALHGISATILYLPLTSIQVFHSDPGSRISMYTSAATESSFPLPPTSTRPFPFSYCLLAPSIRFLPLAGMSSLLLELLLSRRNHAIRPMVYIARRARRKVISRSVQLLNARALFLDKNEHGPFPFPPTRTYIFSINCRIYIIARYLSIHIQYVYASCYLLLSMTLINDK